MKQLHPKAVWLFFISFVLQYAIIVFIFLFWLAAVLGEFIESVDNVRAHESWSFLSWLWVVVPVFLIFCFLWAKLSYHFYRYELTEAGFRKELGVIYKKYVTIPYDRIQNVDIHRGIVARLLGLSDLNVQTAGASGAVRSEGRLPGLSREEAEKLRDELIDRARRARTSGL